MDLKELFNEHNFSETEKRFIGNAKTSYTSEMNQSRIVSEFILGKKIENATDKIIHSNERLAESNKKHLIWIRRLTFALVAVGVMQIIIQFIK